MVADHERRSQGQPEQPSTCKKLPEMPPEVLHAVAKAMLAACDSSLGAWNRLSLVSRDWRQALKGARNAALAVARLLTKHEIHLL